MVRISNPFQIQIKMSCFQIILDAILNFSIPKLTLKSCFIMVFKYGLKLPVFEWFYHLVTNLQNVQIFYDSVFTKVRFQTPLYLRMINRITCPLAPKTTKKSPNQRHAQSFQQTETGSRQTDSNTEREKLRLEQHKYRSNMSRKIRHL